MRAQLWPPAPWRVLWQALMGRTDGQTDRCRLCKETGQGCEGWGPEVQRRAALGPPLSSSPAHVTHQIRRLLAVAAAAARARVTGTLTRRGAEGPPPLPGSPGSQIFVVGRGTNELVVLVVVSGEHGGNSGQDQG